MTLLLNKCLNNNVDNEYKILFILKVISIVVKYPIFLIIKDNYFLIDYFYNGKIVNL